MKLLNLDVFYVIAGAFLLVVAVRLVLDSTQPKRWGSALFWGLLAVAFLAGKSLPPVVAGYLVLALVVLAATKQLGAPRAGSVTAAERSSAATRLQNRIFVPALLIPATAVVGTLGLSQLHVGDCWLLDSTNVTVTSVCLGAVVAAGVGLRQVLAVHHPVILAIFLLGTYGVVYLALTAGLGVAEAGGLLRRLKR